MAEQQKRGTGRPNLRDTKHVEMSLSKEVRDYLAMRKHQDGSFSKSSFVDQAVREKIQRISEEATK